MTKSPRPSRTSASPTIAVALGSGGARGIAHIAMLEALDEFGVKPVALSGASIGAIVGAAYAAGFEARLLRTHALRVMRDRTDVMARLLKAMPPTTAYLPDHVLPGPSGVSPVN